MPNTRQKRPFLKSPYRSPYSSNQWTSTPFGPKQPPHTIPEFPEATIITRIIMVEPLLDIYLKAPLDYARRDMGLPEIIRRILRNRGLADGLYEFKMSFDDPRTNKRRHFLFEVNARTGQIIFLRAL